MRANKLRYRLFLGHCAGKNWDLGVGASVGPANGHGNRVIRATQVTSSRHQPDPDKAQAEVIHSWESSSNLFTVKRFSHTSRLMSPCVARVDSSRPAGTARQHGVDFHRSVIPESVSKSAIWLGSRSSSTASETVQDVESTLSNEPDLLNPTVRKEAAMSALKQYLIDVKGASDEDADFISRNCPTFMANLEAFLSVHLLAQRDSVSLELCIRTFIEREDKEVSNGITSSVTKGEVKGPPTLGDMLQLSKFPLALAGQGGLLKSMEILDGLGWSRHRLWQMLDRNPALLTWTAEALQANIFILDKVGVKRPDMLSFIEDSSVFTSDLEERLAPLLQYLEEVGIEWDVLGDLFKFNPQGLIKMPLANFRERVDFLLNLGLSSSEVERSMRVFPQLVHLRLANLTQKIEYFDGIGVDRDSMAKIVAKLPSIFRHSIEKNLVPKVQMLESLGVVESNLVRFIAQYPQFFGCSMENLRQKLDFFETNGLIGERLVKMITWHPRAFSFSVDDNLSKKLEFLVSKGFAVRSTAMVRALASCITISTESLEARFQNLQSLGFPHEEVCDLVRKQPTIFCLSEKTIRAKMDYLMSTMNRSPTEILKCPGYLLYSLELRIKPRQRVVALLTSKGLLREDGYSLSTILQPSEKTFVQRFVSLDPECFDVYVDALEGFNAEQACKADQLVSLGLVPKSDGLGARGLNPSIQDLGFSQKAVVAVT